jgi:NADH-quinone oxidoreductase subunit K
MSNLYSLNKMNLSLFLCTDLLLFMTGAIGTFLNRRNFIIILLCIELMLLSTNLVFLTASTLLDDISGMLIALWVLTAAAAETALGLALCVLHVRLRSTLDVELMNLLKGSSCLLLFRRYLEDKVHLFFFKL